MAAQARSASPEKIDLVGFPVGENLKLRQRLKWIVHAQD